jgi:hypothetical protein
MELPEPFESEVVVAVAYVKLERTSKTRLVALVQMNELREAGMLKKISLVELEEV